MNIIVDFPGLVFALSFIVLWLSAIVGTVVSKRWRSLREDQRDGFGVVQGAVMTLLGLLIGFTFSMAISRYEERKNYEEAEANAIGTEYVRLGLLPAPDAEKARGLLRTYLDERVLFYTSSYGHPLQQINNDTAQLQNQLWSAVLPPAGQSTAMLALTVSGMNDVLNSQGYTQAAWWNRIPLEAWCLLAAISIGCNLLIGYGAPRTRSALLIVFPLAVSVSLFLIADIDSPRRGLIRMHPQNLVSLQQSLRTP